MPAWIANAALCEPSSLEVVSDEPEYVAPPAGLEPAPPAPEAGALSAELRGRALQEQGTIVLVTCRRPSLPIPGLTERPNAAVSCISMPTDHDVATAPLERQLLPRTASVDEKGHLHVGGIDLLELAEEFGTPLFVYDEDAPASRLPRGGGGLGRRRGLRHQGVPLPGHGPPGPRGGHAPRRGDRRRAPRRPVRRRPGGPPRPARQQQVDRRAGRGPRVGVGRIVVDSFDEIARLGGLLESSAPTAARPKVLVRVTPGVEAHTHEFVRTGQEDSKFGFSVSSGAAAEAVAALELLPGGRARRRPRPHREPGLRGVLVRAGGRGARRVLRPARPARAGRRRRPGRALCQRRGGADPGASGPRPPATPAPGPGSTRRRGSRPSPGAPSSPPPASPSTRSARSSTSRASAPT